MATPDRRNLSAKRVGKKIRLYARPVSLETIDGKMEFIDDVIDVKFDGTNFIISYKDQYILFGAADEEAASSMLSQMREYEQQTGEPSIEIKRFGWGPKIVSDGSPIRFKITGSKNIKEEDIPSSLANFFFKDIKRPNIGLAWDNKWKEFQKQNRLTKQGNIITIDTTGWEGQIIDFDPPIAPAAGCLQRRFTTSSTWDFCHDNTTSNQQLTNQLRLQTALSPSGYIAATRSILEFDTSAYTDAAGAVLYITGAEADKTGPSQIIRAHYAIGGITYTAVTDTDVFSKILSAQAPESNPQYMDHVAGSTTWTISDLQTDASWGTSNFNVSFMHGEDDGAGGNYQGDYHDVPTPIGYSTYGIIWDPVGDPNEPYIEITPPSSGNSSPLGGSNPFSKIADGGPGFVGLNWF